MTFRNRTARHLIRAAVTGFQRLRKALWRWSRPTALGVHAVPLTRAGRVVLVRLTYESGWRLPGGGRKAAEPAETAMLRELREEIGLTSLEALERIGDFPHVDDPRRGEAALFIARGVSYRPPRWSLEIEEVAEFDLFGLPADVAPVTRLQLGRAGFGVAGS